MNLPDARRLRRDATEVENRLWQRLRDRQLEGYKFRRQHPLGPFVADFACPEAKLIVELDGGQHGEDDGRRTEWLHSQGYEVIRFWNNEVVENVEGVLERIREVIALRRTPPSPQPSPPLWGGEGVPSEAKDPSCS